MADIMEFVEDIGDGAKKVFKNKKFWLAAAVVGGVALAMGYLKYRDQDNGSTAEDITAYEAIGYAGYPVVGGGGGSEGDSSYSEYYETISDFSSEYDKALLEMQEVYEKDFDALQTNIDDLSEKLISSQELMEQQQMNYQKQADISQMKANSELYGKVSAAQGEALHEENKEIAKKYGWTFNSETGNWYEGKTPVYLAAWQVAQAMESGQKITTVEKKTKAAAATTTFETNAEYQKKVADAIDNGSEAAVTKKLNEQRNAGEK